MIRVLHIVNSMNRGGLETMIMNLYRNVDRTKIQFDFLTHTNQQGDYDEEIEQLGGNIFRISSRRHGLFKNKIQLLEFFRQHPEYKIIHAHASSLSYITPLKIASMANVKTRIIHSHSTKPQKGKIHELLHFINQRKLSHYATNYFACSEKAANWLYGDNHDEIKNIQIINNCIDVRQYTFNSDVRENIRSSLKLTDRFVIGHIGSFREAKNHMFLIDIFKKIHDLKPNAVLMLVGGGDLEKQIKNKVIKLGLSNSVMFMGVRSDIPELLQAMDIFLFPSLYEGLPVTLVEAQAAGLKIIASDSITDEICFTNLVELISLQLPASAWAKKVLSYIDGYKRINTFDEISTAGYDIKTSAKELEQFYLTRVSNG